jgi:hypothetical protein
MHIRSRRKKKRQSIPFLKWASAEVFPTQFAMFHPRSPAPNYFGFSNFPSSKTRFFSDATLTYCSKNNKKKFLFEELMCMCTILAEFQGDKKLTKCPQREIRTKNNILETLRSSKAAMRRKKLKCVVSFFHVDT